MTYKEHPVIWLQPYCRECFPEDRLWCPDNVWEEGCECGYKPVKYVLAKEEPYYDGLDHP